MRRCSLPALDLFMNQMLNKLKREKKQRAEQDKVRAHDYDPPSLRSQVTNEELERLWKEKELLQMNVSSVRA